MDANRRQRADQRGHAPASAGSRPSALPTEREKHTHLSDKEKKTPRGTFFDQKKTFFEFKNWSSGRKLVFISFCFFLFNFSFFDHLEVTDHLFSFLFHFFLFLFTVSIEVYFSITSLISFHSFQKCHFLFIFECFSCCSCFTFVFILKDTHHQSNHHEEARATTKKRVQKEGEKIRKTTPTPKKGRQGTPLLNLQVHNCPIWFYLTSCTLATLFYYISFHFKLHMGTAAPSKRRRRKAAPPTRNRRRKQHHPKEVEGRGDAAPTEEEGRQGQQPLYFFSYLTFILLWFNLSCANFVTFSIFKNSEEKETTTQPIGG